MSRKSFGSILKTTARTLAWIAGIWVALLVILEIAFSSPVLTRIVNSYASEYVDGSLNFGKASLSFFKRFPAAVLTLEDVSVTYPAERYDSLERAGVQGHLIYAGCGESADTLASFRKFSVGVSLPALVSGTIKVPYMRLDKPRVFAHSYSDGSANWNMFGTSEDLPEETEETEEADSTADDASSLKIVIGKVMMTGKPHVVYTDCRDSIFALVSMRRFELNGNINSKRIDRSRIGLTLDSMFVAGRISRDTLAFGLDHLYMHEKDKAVNIDMSSKALVATREFGRLQIPISVSGILSFPKGEGNTVCLNELNANLAHIPLKGDARISICENSAQIKAQMNIDRCPVGKIVDSYVSHIMTEANEISTDALLNVSVNIDGEYDLATGKLPQMKASLSIPSSTTTYSSFPDTPLTMEMNIGAEIDAEGRANLDINRLGIGIPGSWISATCQAKDLMADDPALNIDAELDAELSRLKDLIPAEYGIQAEGSLHGTIKGEARLSQLSIYNFSSSSLNGEIVGKGILVDMPEDTISANIDGLKITLGPEKLTSRRAPDKVINLVGIKGEIAKADIQYGSSMAIRTEGFRVSAKNSMDTKIEADSTFKINPFSGRLSADRLSVSDSDGTTLRLTETSNGFYIFPKKGSPKTPVLTLTSKNKWISLKYNADRIALSEANMKVTATMNTFEKKHRMQAFVDSLSRIYPYIPKDSLVRHHFAKFRNMAPARGSFTEDDFASQDIDISLDKSIARYFNEWDIDGKLNVGKGFVRTPSFPLRNSLKGFGLRFTNDYVQIDSLNLMSGKSDLSATGKLSGLKRALMGRKGALKLDVEVVSEKMDGDELLLAYTTGSTATKEDVQISEELDEEAFMEEIVLDTANTSSLIVIPKNLNADISLIATNVNYSDLKIDLACADLIVKDRCVQITNTQALSNMGEIHLDGFYATSSKEDIKAGFNLAFKDITAEKVINLMPSVDTLMPLLKSFGGNLNCELAATARMDTTMNIIMPSINGILRIGGKDLYIKDNEIFHKMAKLLIFKNKNEGHINNMTVEGIIKDSKVEVFPFILEMDRYMLGLSGVQNMDMSFRYHASLIKSPFIIKVGMDIYGDNFDNMKFKIGKPKYKSKDVPVFSAVIDDAKVNLVKSIRNVFDRGVDNVMKENMQRAIEEHKKKIGYVQAVDQQMEVLSEKEQQDYEAETQSEQN